MAPRQGSSVLVPSTQPTTNPSQKCLTSFYGIGPQVASGIMSRLYIYPGAKVNTLAQKQILDIAGELSHLKIENELRRSLVETLTRLRDMKSYRGLRHAQGLPVRGQRTQTQTATSRKLNKVERRG